MQSLMVALMAGMFGGIAAAVLWALMWTVLIPWPDHEIFLVLVFVLGGFGSAALSIRSMLS